MFLRCCFCEIFELMGKFHTTTGGHVVQSTINRVILILGSYLLHSRTSHTSLMRTEQQQQQQKKIEQYITIYKSATIENAEPKEYNINIINQSNYTKSTKTQRIIPSLQQPSRQRKQSVSEDNWALIIDENEQNVTKGLFSDHSDTCSNDDRHDEQEHKTRKRQLQQQKKTHQYIYHHLQSKVQNQSNTTTSISINEAKQNRRRPNESPHHRNSH